MSWLLFLAILPATSARAESGLSQEDQTFFEEQVRPIFVNRCYECHSADADTAEGELYLDRKVGWERGGARGPAIIPGKPDASLLLETLTYEDPDLQMPPDRKLPDREVKILREWVQRGAPDPRTDEAEHVTEADDFDLAQRIEDHWAWTPPTRPEVPDVENADWVLDPIDAFVLDRLTAAELKPAPAAEKLTWLRRVTFDITGLPPTREELQRFSNDNSADAYERVVDALLKRQSFGECWGQHWLDLMRYAETKGHEGDYEIPDAWRYRDYVIRAFNENIPYDDFVREHLAGDLLPNPRIDTESKTNQSIQGTGFWFLGEATHSPVDIRGEEADRVANQIDVFGKAFLGLTVACARCHDHKFDAITTADYYAIGGLLQSSGYQLANVADPAALAKAAGDLDSLNRNYSASIWKSYAATTQSRLKDFSERLIEAGRQAQKLKKATETDAKTKDEKKKEQTGGNTDGADDPNERLAQQLIEASNNVEHPLFAFAKLSLSSPETTWKNACSQTRQRLIAHANHLESSRQSQQVTTTRREGELNRIASQQPFSAKQHILATFDAGSASERAWLTSGLSFTNRPAGSGEIFLTSNPARPISGLAEVPVATNRRLSDKLTGLYRTETFEVTADRLWYRFRGKAKAFLAIDSHRTVAGPLHQIVQRGIDSKGKTVWQQHRVDDYLGHRIHVEFHPEGEFSLLEVRYSDGSPPSDWTPDPKLIDALDGELSDLAAVAAHMEETLRDALRASEDHGCVSASARQLELLNWLIDHDDCLVPDGENNLVQVATQYAKERKQIENSLPSPVWAVAMLDGDAENEFVHLRGSHHRLAETETPRGTLQALGGAVETQRGSGRLDVAENMVAANNPLTARVQVNRVWHHLFGAGLVASTDNFGVLGESPTHPELLDYLAIEFVENGWNVKQLIRRLVLSQTYRMSSRGEAKAVEIDPANKLLHSARVRRLTAEKIRDTLLSVSGQLDTKTHGPSVRIHITDFMRHNRSPGWSGPVDGDRRRSIYVEVRRNAPSHFLAAFDKPVAFTTVGKRASSNSPAQPLILLNDPLVHQLAEKLATVLVDEFNSDTEAVKEAYLRMFGRPASDTEIDSVTQYLAARAAAQDSERTDRIEAWSDVCLTLFNVKEFIFLR